VLIRAEARGVRIDQDAVTPLRAQYLAQREETHAELVSVLGEDALGGDQALLDALLEHGVPLHRRTPGGELSTNKFALAEFEKDYPVLATLSEYRQACKFLSTYIEPMVDREVVHTSFWQMGAWTGRMSCSRPNMQNIPARAGTEVREMFVPRPGHSFVVADYDAIEVRLLAHYLNAPEYMQMIEEGLDPHAWMASQVWGGVPEDYEKGTDGEKQRTIAKNVLFAIVYGAGGPRVADMLGIPIQEARDLIRSIKTTLPRYLDLTSRIKTKVQVSGYVTTIMGRKQTVKRDKSYIGLNALIQGSAADIFKAGAVRVEDGVKDFGGVPVLFVHDEIVVEVPTEHAGKCQDRVEAAMNNAYPLRPQLAVTSTIVHNNYGEAK
jgi:DNA polymerase I